MSKKKSFKSEETRTFKSANQAYNNFVDNMPEEQRPSFKDWLTNAKNTGILDKLVPKLSEKPAENKDTTNAATTPATPPAKKPMRPLGMHPAAFAVVALVAAGAVGYGIYQLVKVIKKK